MAKFYITQVISFLEYIHSMNVVYRDLKPENLMISSNGYLKVIDFGFAKEVIDHTFTFCGTVDYISPEIIKCQGHTIYSDYWSLGVLLFEFLTGYTPFMAKTPMESYEKIMRCDYVIPGIVNPLARDLIKKLLVIDSTKRLGCKHNGIEDIMLHEWFAYYQRNKFNWRFIYEQKYDAPYLPELNSPQACESKEEEEKKEDCVKEEVKVKEEDRKELDELDNNDIMLSKQQVLLFDCFNDLINIVNKHDINANINEEVEEEEEEECKKGNSNDEEKKE